MNHRAIYNTHPIVTSIVDNDDGTFTCYNFDGEVVDVDMDLCNQEAEKLQANYESKQYQRDRAAEYPPLEDQLDYIYHNGVEAWKTDIIDPVKAKYPKPE